MPHRGTDAAGGRHARDIAPGYTQAVYDRLRSTGAPARPGFDAACLAGLSLRGDLALLGRMTGAPARHRLLSAGLHRISTAGLHAMGPGRVRGHAMLM